MILAFIAGVKHFIYPLTPKLNGVVKKLILALL
jgi:hypothetical protein